ncbi:uncharacterized protein F54H12.2-like [Mytilus edulis]|uniref:uncharacterized protein F54H12.2-like n=1 Tax=Mytilus edulis TaxID=6550 RepID=UPI0039EED850
MNHLEENHEDELSLFSPPPANTGIQRREWIEFRPTNQISADAPLDFSIPAQSAAYMDLKRSSLKVKLRLLKADGTSVAKDTNVALVNLSLQALFSEVECSLQQTPVAQMGSNYPFKAYIDTLLETGASDKVLLDSQLFMRDTAGHLDDANVQGGANQGLYRRSLYTREGRILEMEGPLHLDVFRQHRLLLNGIPLTLKLWPSKNAFRLMSSDDDAAYRVQILDAAFKVCLQTPNAGVLMAHSKLLGDATAMYPFVTSHFKTASVSKGEYGFIENNLFQGDVPSQLIVALVSSEAFSGSYKRSPFNFQGFDCNFLGLYVDGQSYPSQPLQPNFAGRNYVDAYRTLATFRDDVDVSLLDYAGGFALFVLNVDDRVDFNAKRRGDCRLVIKFGTPLPESVTVLMYGKFPKVMHVDQSRRVLLQ